MFGRDCPQCGVYVPTRYDDCTHCGHIFRYANRTDGRNLMRQFAAILRERTAYPPPPTGHGSTGRSVDPGSPKPAARARRHKPDAPSFYPPPPKGP